MAKAFEVSNPDGLTSAIRGLEEIASESVLRQAAVAGARVIFEEVKLRAPVSARTYEGKDAAHPPGFLRDHILIAYDQEESVKGKLATYIVTWSRDAFYGRFVEYGTSKMAPQSFLRPAYEAKKTAAAQAVDDVIQTKVKELTGGQ